tara:strand:- start:273 stop:1025 length:753 start_codon:yes stop_codon:yes gene_type:complete
MARRDELYEIDVAREIDNGLPEGFNATRPKVSSKYSDILITGPSSTWVEVKMNHTDNLHNIRYFYDDGMWQVKPDAKSRATDALLKEINKSPNIKDWVADIKKYMAEKYSFDPDKLSMYSTKTERSQPHSVSPEQMKEYLATQPTKNIGETINVDIGYIATLHYNFGKAEPAYYMQTGDDFYRIGGKDPLGLGNEIPLFKTGSNRIMLRVGSRTGNFELQSELKAKSVSRSSKYSVAPGTKKLNPFTLIN